MFNKVEDIKEFLINSDYEDSVVFENPDFSQAFIGVSQDGRAIYSYNNMIAWLCTFDEMTPEEAMEWISYNTLRSIPHMGDKAPIICYDISEDF